MVIELSTEQCILSSVSGQPPASHPIPCTIVYVGVSAHPVRAKLSQCAIIVLHSFSSSSSTVPVTLMMGLREKIGTDRMLPCFEVNMISTSCLLKCSNAGSMVEDRPNLTPCGGCCNNLTVISEGDATQCFFYTKGEVKPFQS